MRNPYLTDTPAKEAKQRRTRLALLGLSALSTIFLVGAPLGWGAMQLMLEANGSFASECSSLDNNEICDAQTSMLIRIALVMNITQITSPLLGNLVDSIGTPNFVCVMSFAGLLGMTLIAIAIEASSADFLLYVGFPLLSVCTWMGSLIIVQLGFYFQGHTASRVIFILNTLFDSGALTYWLLWLIHDQTGDQMIFVWIGYMTLAASLYSGLIFFWRVAVPESQVDVPDETGDTERNSTGVELETQDIESSVVARSPGEQLTSPAFLLLCLFFCIQVMVNQWNFATQRNFLAHLGDDENGNRYLSIFTILTPVSILGAPFMDYLILHFGWTTALHTINILALTFLVIKIASESLNVQIIGFVVFSFFRSFLFGVSFSFLPTLVTGPVIGTGAGIMNGLAGLMSFLSIPLAHVAVNQLGGNFLWPNVIILFLQIPCILSVSFLGLLLKTDRKEQNVKEESVALE